MTRLACLIAVLVAFCVAPQAAVGVEPSGSTQGARQTTHWAAPQIGTVVGAGLLGGRSDTFRPDDPLTRGELYDALSVLGLPAVAPTDPGRRVTIKELDAKLVAALGMTESARTIRLAVRDAGLTPKDYLGTETVARLLGLRSNHATPHEDRELLPTQPATRAEAALSLARVMALREWDLESVRTRAAAFTLPDFDDGQREVLSRAVRFVGFPYVWAGMSERTQVLYYGTTPGGFDCSGFVWRVFKLEPFASMPALGTTLKGRTSYVMSAEVPRKERVGRRALAPGDVVFFGARGPKSKPAQVDHMGIYVGNGWFVHSSRNGVTLQPLTGWYETRFAWARRPLAEASSLVA